MAPKMKGTAGCSGHVFFFSFFFQEKLSRLSINMGCEFLALFIQEPAGGILFFFWGEAAGNS